MKGIKKALSVIICTAIIFATFPVAVYAASTLQDGDFVFTVEGGKATIVHYSGQTESEVTIPVSLNGYPVTAIGDGAFASCGILSQITVPDGVLSIGNSAFAACENLKYAHLADSITYIGEGAFYGCNSLGNINIPKSLTVISSESFSSCYSISSITLPNKIEIIGSGAFKSCYNLSEVSIPKSVTVIGANAFSENYSLNKIYYCGTQDEWNRIEINSNNSSLTEKTDFIPQI